MNRRAYLLPTMPAQEWSTFIWAMLSRSDLFVGYFPRAEYLAFGRQAFAELEGAEIAPWTGMEDSEAIRVALTDEVRKFIFDLETEHPPGSHPKLWTYDLYAKNEILLHAHDFNLYLVFASEQDLRHLSDLGIEINEWEEIELPFDKGIDETRLDSTFVDQLINSIKRTFNMEDEGEGS